MSAVEATLAGAMLEPMQILAYRKKGGSQLVLNMREPEILARCARRGVRKSLSKTLPTSVQFVEVTTATKEEA